MQSIVCSGVHASSLKRPTVKRSGNLHFILQTDFGTNDIGSTRSQPECQMFGGTRCWKATFVLAWSWFCRREGYWFERSDCLNVSSENEYVFNAKSFYLELVLLVHLWMIKLCEWSLSHWDWHTHYICIHVYVYIYIYATSVSWLQRRVTWSSGGNNGWFV